MPPRGHGHGPGPGPGAGRGGAGGYGFSSAGWMRDGAGPLGHYYARPITPPPGGFVGNPSETISQTLAGYWINTRDTFKASIKRQGVIKGVITGFRKLTSGQLRYSSFVGKIAMYDKQYKDERLEERTMKVRKMRAAKNYYKYLYKIGYYDQDDYVRAMNEMASIVGVKYIDEYYPEYAETHGRSR